MEEIKTNIIHKKEGFQSEAIKNKNFKEYEIEHGGTKLPNGVVTKAGAGIQSTTYETKSEINQKQYNEYAKKETELELSLIEFNKSLSDFEINYEMEQFNNSLNICNEIVAKYSQEHQGICDASVLNKSVQSLNIEDFKKTCNIELLGEGFNKDLLLARKCISKANLEEDIANSMLEKLDRVQKTEGDHAHQFIIVTNELIRNNRLAVGTLVLAIIMDLLILFCSLLGARNESFLYMTVDDLLKKQEQVFEIMLSANSDSVENDSEMIKKIKLILNTLDLNKNYEETKYPAILSQENIESLGLQKFLGILRHLNLVKTLDDGSVGFRNRAILWMNDQIVKNDLARSAEKDLYQFMKEKDYE